MLALTVLPLYLALYLLLAVERVVGQEVLWVKTVVLVGAVRLLRPVEAVVMVFLVKVMLVE
jgi:hypothetical protein